MLNRHYDPNKRDSSWQMVIPGCYIDPAGLGHIFPDEILAELQRQHPEVGFDVFSRDDYDLVVAIFTAELRRRFPRIGFEFVRHERGDS